MKKILFINSPFKECGIHLFGSSIYNALSTYDLKYFTIHYSECNNLQELDNSILNINPDVVILNRIASIHGWINSYVKPDNIIFIDILHESSDYMRYNTNNVFTHHIVANPFIDDLGLPKNFYPLPRLIPDFKCQNEITKSSNRVIVGMSSFGILDRGWLQALEIVKRDIPDALVKFHMPFNSVIDMDGRYYALHTASLCRQLASKLNIELEINHSYLELSDFYREISQNTINIFQYQLKEQRGVSSAIDNGLAVKVPIAINSSPIYSHLKDIEPIINVEKNSLQSIISKGTSILEPYYKKWGKGNFCSLFESTINGILK